MRAKTLSVYCAAHFIVDFCCALFMFSLLRSENYWMSAVLIYNFCAFALQMPFGLLADRLSRNALVAAAGCILVALSPMFSAGIITAAVMGIGNALFHVGGGVDVLNLSDSKCSPLGLFVSPGALGLCLGGMLRGVFPLHAACILLAAIAVIIVTLSHRKGSFTENLPLKLNIPSKAAIFSLICLFAVVCLRSFAGMSFSFGWKTSIPALVTVGCVALGKALGGFAADAMGSRIASIISLSLCAVLFVFSENPICGLAALLLFNMTMPITLWETAKLFPNARGFSFGLLTFALFIGFLPTYFGTPALTAVFSAATAFVSMLLLLCGIRKGQKNDL